MLFTDIKNNFEIDNSLIERIKNAINLNLRTQIKRMVPNLHPADQAELITNLNKEERKNLINILSTDFDGQVMLKLQKTILNEIIDLFDSEDLINILSKLSIRNTVSILTGLKDEKYVQSIVNSIEQKSKKELIEQSLSYPENTVGRLMSLREYSAVPMNWTIHDVIKYIQKNRTITGNFNEIVIVNENFQPISTVSSTKILMSEENILIADIMKNPDSVKILQDTTTKSEAAALFSKYNLRSAPIVNKKGILIGVIYLSDIVEVVKKGAEKGLLSMGKVSEDDTHINLLESAKKRLPWLIVTIVTTSLGSLIINAFSHTVQTVIALAALMPLLAGLGGVSGTQTLTVMIKNIATHKVNKDNYKKLILKETMTGLLNGLMLGCFAFFFILIWQQNLKLSIIFGITIVFVLLIAGFMASVVPILIHKLKFDPAISSGSFITTTVDSLSFFILLKLASLFLA